MNKKGVERVHRVLGKPAQSIQKDAQPETENDEDEI
jgi:hypothetical protein